MGDRRDQLAGQLSYGWQKTLTLAIGLATRPNLLLLDEPLTGISPSRIDAIGSLIRSARESGTTICLIEHNVNLLMGLVRPDRRAEFRAEDGRWKTRERDPGPSGHRILSRRMSGAQHQGPVGGTTGFSRRSMSSTWKCRKGRRSVCSARDGSGKSTILKAVSGLKKPSSGEIRFQETRIDGEKPEDIVRWGIGSILEGRRLFPYMTVIENLKMGAFARSDKIGIRDDLEGMLERFPILKEKANDRAGHLSGGSAGDRGGCPRLDGEAEAAGHG